MYAGIQMTLSSPLEDLQRSTLQAIAGVLRKLEYLAGLRSSAGHYAHWGFSRAHGETAADESMAKAHRSALSRALSTPLRRLMQEVEEYSRECNIPPAVYVEQLLARNNTLLPPEPGAGSARHLNSVLHALSEVEKNRPKAATRPAA